MSAPRKSENQLVSFVINIIIPLIILKKLSAPERLGPMYALIVALIFPIGYGLREFFQRKSFNLISGLGFFSVLLTGGIGLLQVDVFWFAVKEAIIPLMLGLMVLMSLQGSNPIVKTFLYNDSIFHIEHIDSLLTQNRRHEDFKVLMRKITLLLATSFMLSAFLNYTVARMMVTSSSGTEAFNNEVGNFMFWSFLIIALPCTFIMFFALWILMTGLQKLTGLSMDQLLRSGKAKK